MAVNEWKTGEIRLSVEGTPLTLKLTVPDWPVKPQVMLPLFQQLANAFTDLGVSQVERNQQQISCQKRCGACCRQPVPLAEVEIYHIATLVDQMPEPRRATTIARFEAASSHFRSKDWLSRFEACSDEIALREVIREYFFDGVACPFLEHESCSIHPQRPIACREYLVTSPKEHCAAALEEGLEQMPLPLTASQGIGKVGASGKLSQRGYLPMVFALDWVKAHPEGFEEKTGEEWLAAFFS